MRLSAILVSLECVAKVVQSENEEGEEEGEKQLSNTTRNESISEKL